MLNLADATHMQMAGFTTVKGDHKFGNVKMKGGSFT